MIFHWLSESAVLFSLNKLILFSSLRNSQKFVIKISTTYPKALKQILAVIKQCMNINMLTIFVVQLRQQLGPTNSWLINSAKKPLLFRRFPFSGNFAPTDARIIVSVRSILSYERTSTQTERLSTSILI